jgi:sigma-B regulation protein RsbU (phosphoserine phosphatase)
MKVEIRPGDLVMLFTDGLYDVAGAAQDKFELDWVVEQVRQRTSLPAGTLFDELIAQIRNASEDGEFADDVCLVGMEVGPEA